LLLPVAVFGSAALLVTALLVGFLFLTPSSLASANDRSRLLSARSRLKRLCFAEQVAQRREAQRAWRGLMMQARVSRVHQEQNAKLLLIKNQIANCARRRRNNCFDSCASGALATSNFASISGVMQHVQSADAC
jgi:hypothetical protein